MGTPFEDLYDLVRSLTGNEDWIVGAEILPDERVAVLLRTAIKTLPTYSTCFQSVSCNLTTGSPELVVTNVGVAPGLETELAVAYAAAHRYFLGIGSRLGVSETLGAIYKLAEIVGGGSVISATETDLAAASSYISRKQTEAQAQKNLR